MAKLIGIHYLLALMPIWFTAIVLWLATDGAIHLMRDKLEGLGYQVSYAAKYGDAVLLIAVLIAATMLQRDGVYVPQWLQSVPIQGGVLALCVGLGAFIAYKTLGMRSGQVADMYHDVVIAPAILFFAVMLLPIIIVNVAWGNGHWYEGMAVVLAALIWTGLVVIDFKYGRMNQRQWLVSHGFAIKGEIPHR